MTVLRANQSYTDPVVTSFEDVVALLNGDAVDDSGTRLWLSSVAQPSLFIELFREVARLRGEVAELRGAIGSEKA
jgi:hypothetical protein